MRKAGKKGNKYKKRNKRYPVITLVLHFGMKKWTKPLSLADTFGEMEDYPEEMRPLIHDYRINVFNIAHLTMEQVKLFKSDFKYVAEYLVCKRLHKDYQPDDELLRHKDEVLKLMKAITGDQRYEEIIQQFQGKERISMCEVLEKKWQQGIQQGIQQGMQQGIQQGIQQGMQQGEQRLLISLTKDGLISVAEAAKRAHMDEKEFSLLLQ